MYSYKASKHYIFFVLSLIMYDFSTPHFMAMCNIINVNCFMELIYRLILNMCIFMQFNYLNATV